MLAAGLTLWSIATGLTGLAGGFTIRGRGSEPLTLVFPVGAPADIIVAIRSTRLHAELYAGVLRTHLREDIATSPHITNAAHGDLPWCDAYAKRLNRTQQPVRGVIESVTLVDITATKIESLARFVPGTVSEVALQRLARPGSKLS